MKVKYLILVLFVIALSGISELKAQIFKLPKYYRQHLNVDSISQYTPDGLILFPEVNVYPRQMPKTAREKRQYEKLVRNFIKVYPYVLELSQTYRNIDDTLSMIRSDKDKDIYLRVRERQIMNYYRPILTRFTISQGVLMVKLLDRESGNTAYEVVKDLKGNVTAFFWQGFALMFGNNLKMEYDAYGDDKTVEYLVMRYRDKTL